ncbi:tyrosine-type recombinase/integrase [Streptomyces sp. NRRL S-241]|uniref:tyrosine-type recombinase/integrase n=1 Tax=Streptomyces sp. NRRL S-241 TaxID=1463896 RepID=UPI0004C2201A|nr:site-specific integrase [Streptomyces sp. NRRL S-241]
MASVHPRTNRAGEITSYQVKWRDGGGRNGAWQSETFEDETAAGVFKAAVDEAGNRWPPGWVKGRGYIVAEPDEPDEMYRFRVYATTMITNRAGIEERYRRDCLRDLDTYIFPTFGECDVRSTKHFSSDTIDAWLRKMEQTKIWRGAEKKNLSPKTIRNFHGLLSSVLERAVLAEPPLRDRNPCRISSLPRVDDEIDDEMCFLTPQEVKGLKRCFSVRQDQLLVSVAYGTGLRFGELTALTPRDITDRDTSKPKLRVQRAWKRDEEGAYFLGPPKTKKARRTIRISRSVLEALDELGLYELGAGDLLFTGANGTRLHYSTFGDRWAKAVRLAREAGVFTADKSPTPHDLRHSHVAALISKGHGLPYVQRRIGHQSIQTTNDVYGHLLPEADDDAMETIEESLAGGRRPLRSVG